METRSLYLKLLFADNLHRTTYQNLSRYLLILNKWRFTLDYLSMATVYIISARACKLSDGNAIHYRSDQISVAAAEGTRNISILIDKIHLCKENGRNLKDKVETFCPKLLQKQQFYLQTMVHWFRNTLHYLFQLFFIYAGNLLKLNFFYAFKLFFLWIRRFRCCF